MTVVTTALVKEIRALLRDGMTQRDVADALGINVNTVHKYQNDWMIQRMKGQSKARWQREKNDPALLEKKRRVAREWQRKRRASNGSA